MAPQPLLEVIDLVSSDGETAKRPKIVHTGAKSTNFEDIVATLSASEIGHTGTQAMKSTDVGGNVATMSTSEGISPIVKEESSGATKEQDSRVPSIAEEESSSDNEVLQNILLEARKKLQKLKEPESNPVKYANSDHDSENSYISGFLENLAKDEHGVTIDPDAPVQESTVASEYMGG